MKPVHKNEQQQQQQQFRITSSFNVDARLILPPEVSQSMSGRVFLIKSLHDQLGPGNVGTNGKVFQPGALVHLAKHQVREAQKISWCNDLEPVLPVPSHGPECLAGWDRLQRLQRLGIAQIPRLHSSSIAAAAHHRQAWVPRGAIADTERVVRLNDKRHVLRGKTKTHDKTCNL